MAIDSETLQKLSEIDMPADAFRQVIAVLASVTAKEDARKQKDRERKKAGKSSENTGKILGENTVISNDPSVGISADSGTPRAPAFFIGEDSSYISPSDTSYPQAPLKSESVFEKPKAAKPKASDVRTILETVLTPEVATGVIDHRKKLRKPLTAMAAQGLAKQFAATGYPDDAARMMVERGWQGFKGEWFENDRSAAQPRGSPSPKRLTEVDYLLAFAEKCDRMNGKPEPEKHGEYRPDESEITLASSEYREGPGH